MADEIKRSLAIIRARLKAYETAHAAREWFRTMRPIHASKFWDSLTPAEQEQWSSIRSADYYAEQDLKEYGVGDLRWLIDHIDQLEMALREIQDQLDHLQGEEQSQDLQKSPKLLAQRRLRTLKHIQVLVILALKHLEKVERANMTAAMFHVEDIINGRQTAFVVPANTLDQVQPSPDGQLEHIDAIAIGQHVHKVNHVGPLISRVGSVITVKNLPDLELTADVVILSIQLVRASQLTEQQLHQLGRPRREHPGGVDFLAEMGDRRAWFVRVMLASEAPAQ